MGVAKLNQPLSKTYTERLTTIRGKITFRMLTQESREKVSQLYEEVIEKLTNLAFDLDVVFKNILLVIDNGLETLNLGDTLNRRSLSGNFAYKVIENEKY